MVRATGRVKGVKRRPSIVSRDFRHVSACKFPGPGGNVCAVEGFGVGENALDGIVEGPGAHAITSDVDAEGNPGGRTLGEGSVLGGRGIWRARARAFASADIASGLARLPDRSLPNSLPELDLERISSIE